MPLMGKSSFSGFAAANVLFGSCSTGISFLHEIRGIRKSAQSAVRNTLYGIGGRFIEWVSSEYFV